VAGRTPLTEQAIGGAAGSMESKEAHMELEKGQIWRPRDGAPERQVDDIRCARLGDKFPLGEIIVIWASSASKWGMCSKRSFCRWIAHHRAASAVPLSRH
jgi:hypothetical protein